MSETARTSEIAELLNRLAEILAQPVEPVEQIAQAPPPRVLLTPEEAADTLGIGRTTVFRLLRDGELESVQIGRLRRIPSTAVQEYARRLVQKTAKSTNSAA